MIIVMKHGAGQREIEAVEKVLRDHQLGVHISNGSAATIIGVIGDKSALAGVNLEMMDGVDKCVPIMHSYKLASREICPEEMCIRDSCEPPRTAPHTERESAAAWRRT